MFICEQCHEQQPPRTSPTMKVVLTRPVTYVSPSGEDISKGWEIVKEIRLCQECQVLDIREIS